MDEVVDEIEARFRLALAWHKQRGNAEGERIFFSMLDWNAANRAGLSEKLY